MCDRASYFTYRTSNLTYIPALFIVGLLLLVAALGSHWFERLPLSSALLYLVVGISMGPHGLEWIYLRPNAEFIERLTEFVVIVSVFACGLKMSRPLRPAAWQTTVRLIGILMPLSIVAIAAISHWLVGLEWGAAILLGAFLAPTDPVLASEVQLDNPNEDDELRFGLTSEGGLNDALAFPFVYFGLYWITKGNWQSWFRQWVLVDLLWAIAAGLVMGVVVSKTIIWLDRILHRHYSPNPLMVNLVALSTLLLTYSLTELINGYGFLAAFVAGVTLCKSYPHDSENHASQLLFMEQIEKLLEVGVILLLGSLLQLTSIRTYAADALIITAAVLLIVRPLGVAISLWRSPVIQPSQWLMGWFGIRGVGSLYYLTYALGEGFTGATAEQVAWIVYTVIIISIALHGISSTPLMDWYDNRIKGLVKE